MGRETVHRSTVQRGFSAYTNQTNLIYHENSNVNIKRLAQLYCNFKNKSIQGENDPMTITNDVTNEEYVHWREEGNSASFHRGNIGSRHKRLQTN
jgi:hypothetical protein